jgi:hypothetical protein
VSFPRWRLQRRVSDYLRVELDGPLHAETVLGPLSDQLLIETCGLVPQVFVFQCPQHAVGKLVGIGGVDQQGRLRHP